ncbi:hypothetical protein NKI12_26780 [Mesorhizobium australicum]|uniref:Uncharacterized protein n=1 Tax=Mesorhizobium australicum TaxID=536018 RepID=A0ACC6T6C3_9HYPH
MMIAEGVDGSIELFEDRILISKTGKPQLSVPLADISETRFRPAAVFSDGHLQICARETMINGMLGTIFFRPKAGDDFGKLRTAINQRIVTPAEPTAAIQDAEDVGAMRIMLSSGTWIHVDRIKLYDAAKVTEIATLQAQAAKALGPSGGMVGVFGSPSVTLAAEAATLSLISGFIASVTQKQGVEALRKAQGLYQEMLMRSGRFFDVQCISGIRLPKPGAWFADHEGYRHVHGGDDFLWVETSQGPLTVNWPHISVVRFVSVPPAIAP